MSGAGRVPECGDDDYVRCPECQASRYERHLDPCSLRPTTTAGLVTPTPRPAGTKP